MKKKFYSAWKKFLLSMRKMVRISIEHGKKVLLIGVSSGSSRRLLGEQKASLESSPSTEYGPGANSKIFFRKFLRFLLSTATFARRDAKLIMESWPHHRVEPDE